MYNSVWEEVDSLSKHFKFANFKQSLDFVNKVGELAEAKNHHPDIKFGWGYVDISLFTHSENAITEKDRALAEQIDKLFLN